MEGLGKSEEFQINKNQISLFVFKNQNIQLVWTRNALHHIILMTGLWDRLFFANLNGIQTKCFSFCNDGERGGGHTWTTPDVRPCLHVQIFRLLTSLVWATVVFLYLHLREGKIPNLFRFTIAFI
jgi:hypothetical protein